MTTMPRRWADLFRWLLLTGFLCGSSCQGVSSTSESKTGQSESKPRVFSPRMDYDEWTPLGRGDPLKNNPTFDYVPPVLDRVQYWLDSHTTEPSAKRDILVLGVTAKKTSPKIPDQFLKFVDGPKFSRPSQDVSFRNDFTGSTGAEPPKVVRTSSFRNGPIDYRNQNRIQSIPASYYSSPYFNQKSKPYTMMRPPPLIQKDKIASFAEPTEQFSTQTEEGPVLRDSQFFAVPAKAYGQQQGLQGKPQGPSKSPGKAGFVSQVETIKSVYASSPPQSTKSRHESITTPTVSFEKSNLIYQSTETVSGGWPASNILPSTPTTSGSSQFGWQAADYSRDQYEIEQHVPAASSNHEVIVEQNANIIVDGESKENEEVVIGQKEVAPTNQAPSSTEDVARPATNDTSDLENGKVEEDSTGQPPERMHIVVANSSPASLDVQTRGKTKAGPVAVVMPTRYADKDKSAASSSVEIVESMTSLPMTTERPGEKASKSDGESTRDSVPSPPIPSADIQPSGPFPDRIVSSHRQHSYSQNLPNAHSRHPSNSQHAFPGSPQAPLQSMMHPQSRPSPGIMHFLGSMRPGMNFRLPGSMSMSPPMAHMHPPPPPPPPPPMPPMKPVATPNHMVPSMTMDQAFRAQSAMPFTDSPVSSMLAAQAEVHRPRVPDMITLITTPTPFLPTVSSSETSTLATATADHDSKRIEQPAPLRTILNTEPKEDGSPTTSPPRVTTVASMTTDPIFSHYKQPAKPIRGPMYLIIQGHSKVKTYKPTVSKHDVPVDKNEIAEGVTERQLSKLEQLIKENTKSSGAAALAAAEKKKAEEKARAEKLAQVRQKSLMSLVQSGLGSFTLQPSSLATEEEHQPNSVTTVEITGN